MGETTMLGFTSRNGIRSLSVPCDCAYYDHIHLSFFLEDDEGLPLLTVAIRNRPVPFWDRVKAAWAILRGREYYFEEVLLEDAAVNQVRDFLTEWIDRAPEREMARQKKYEKQ